jgi:hypothetical protein
VLSTKVAAETVCFLLSELVSRVLAGANVGFLVIEILFETVLELQQFMTFSRTWDM